MGSQKSYGLAKAHGRGLLPLRVLVQGALIEVLSANDGLLSKKLVSKVLFFIFRLK